MSYNLQIREKSSCGSNTANQTNVLAHHIDLVELSYFHRLYLIWAAILLVMYGLMLPRKRQAMIAQPPNAVLTSQTYFKLSA